MSLGHPISGAARSPDQWSGSVERLGTPILRTDGRTDGLTNVFVTSQDSTAPEVTRAPAYGDFPDAIRSASAAVDSLWTTSPEGSRP